MVNLYRIWSFDSNDRREIARIKAFDFETVQEFLLNTFIKPEYQQNIELTDYGLEWNNNTPEECLENIDKCDKCKDLMEIKDIYSVRLKSPTEKNKEQERKEEPLKEKIIK